MIQPSSRRTHSLAGILCTLVLLTNLSFQPAQAEPGAFSRLTDIHGPATSAGFGEQFTILPNGNFVVYDADSASESAAAVGAVYLYDGKTKALISTLTGSSANDRVGSDGLQVLESGDFVVYSLEWHGLAGAITICSAITGCSGTVSEDNSLVGSAPNNEVGSRGVLELTNHNLVVNSPNWDNGTVENVGAVTWCIPSNCKGIVAKQNSLVGTLSNDQVGGNYVEKLSNGNYVVFSDGWNGARGAATWCSGQTGCQGEVNQDNSLVGSTTADNIGAYFVDLESGDYVVYSSDWNVPGGAVDVGAVTWCSGTSGCQGTISAQNSLVGGTASDWIGNSYLKTTASGYVVPSPNWNDPSTSIQDVGAVTWCSNAGGCVGQVRAENSLIGKKASDNVGTDFRLLDADSQTYLVLSPGWDSATKTDVGAVTRCQANSCQNTVVGEGNSLVGAKSGDFAYMNRNDNIAVSVPTHSYSISFPYWDAPVAADTGLVVWCPLDSGCTGVLDAQNGLAGSRKDDHVGSRMRSDMGDGVYVVSSEDWDNGATAANAGAVTFCTQTSCVGKTVSPDNSLVGDQAGDRIRYGASQPVYLSRDGQGAYILVNVGWHGITGAVTLCAGPLGSVPAGCTGVVSAENSLVGLLPGGSYENLQANFFADGTYAVVSAEWNQARGAVTWCPATGCVGAVSEANSLVGSHAGDRVGRVFRAYYNRDFINTGGYVVGSPQWDRDTVVDAGAVTFCGIEGCRGTISDQNSLLGAQAEDLVGDYVALYEESNYIAVNWSWNDGSIQHAGAITWCSGERGGCKGEVADVQNRVSGKVDSSVKELSPEYDPVNEQLIVGRPAENMLTVLAVRIKPDLKVSVSTNPVQPGQAATVTAELSGADGTPGGSVAFSVDGGPSVSVQLADGKAAYPLPSLPGGNHSVTAAYSGDPDFSKISVNLTPGLFIQYGIFLPLTLH